MSFQAYIDSIKARTGKTPEDFRELAEDRGLLEPGVKTGQILSWLKEDFGLGRGHGMAIVLTLHRATQPPTTRRESIARHFRGERARWSGPYERLLDRVKASAPDVVEGPTGSYISLLRKDKKFAIVQVTAGRLDIGIKLKGVAPTARFRSAGSWNSMVTHRVSINEPKEIDAQVIDRLQEAYKQA